MASTQKSKLSFTKHIFSTNKTKDNCILALMYYFSTLFDLSSNLYFDETRISEDAFLVFSWAVCWSTCCRILEVGCSFHKCSEACEISGYFAVFTVSNLDSQHVIFIFIN